MADSNNKGSFDYSKNYWKVPSKRAEQYATERKNKVHITGKKNGQELTDYEAGMRSGYLQCQSDHSGLYVYKKTMDASEQDKEISKTISQEKKKEKRVSLWEAYKAKKAAKKKKSN